METLRKIFNRLRGIPSVYIDANKYLIGNYIPANATILEAGASVGRDTLQMSSLWPKSKIYSFEPVPELFERAKLKIQGLRNVQLYPFALGSESGTTKLFKSSGASDGSSSLLAPAEHLNVHPEVKFESELEVPAYTIDDWANKNNISSIDLMWLDLQGAEFKILESSPKIFSTVKVLYTEVSLVETYKGVVLYPEFRDWLLSKNFEVVHEDLPYSDMGNVLFVRKK
jgi:2-O-methyltransferase